MDVGTRGQTLLYRGMGRGDHGEERLWLAPTAVGGG